MSSDVRATSLNTGTVSGKSQVDKNAVLQKQLAGSASSSQPVNGSGNSKIDPNVKNKRLAGLKKSLLDNYKITYQQFIDIIKNALNISEEELFTCDEKKFEEISNLVETAIDNLNTENAEDADKPLSERLDAITAKLKELYENNDKSIEKTKEVVEQVGTLLDAVKKFGGKEFEKYKSIQEIPPEQLAEVFKKINAHFKNNKGQDKAEKTVQMMHNLLITASKEDRKCVIKAALLAIEKSEAGQFIRKQIENCKTKEEFHELLQNSDIMKSIFSLGLSEEEVYAIADKLYEAARNHGKTEEERRALFDEITSSMNESAEKVMARVEELEKKKQEQGLDEKEQQEYDSLIKAIYSALSGVRASEAKHDPEGAKALDEILKKYNCLDQVYKLIADFAKRNPDKDIVKYMDKSTEGKFSEDYATELADSTDTEPVSTSSEADDFGFPQSVTPQRASEAADNVAKSNLSTTEKTPKYSLEKNEEAPSLAVGTVEDITVYAKIYGWKKAAVAAGKRFQDLTHDAKSTLESYALNMFKNDKGLMAFADKCGNNLALIKSVIAPNIEDGDNIAKLGVDFGTKKVLQNDFKKKHEDDKAEEQS